MYLRSINIHMIFISYIGQKVLTYLNMKAETLLINKGAKILLT